MSTPIYSKDRQWCQTNDYGEGNSKVCAERYPVEDDKHRQKPIMLLLVFKFVIV